MNARKIVIFANGRSCQIREGLHVSGFLKDRGLNPKTVMVELNGEVLPRRQWTGHELQHGDRLEIIRVVAGG